MKSHSFQSAGQKILALVLLSLWLLPSNARGADTAEKSEYEQRVAKAQLDKFPDKHKELAAWCKRKYPEKHQFHVDAWNRHQFGTAESRLPAQPSAMELLRLSEQAAKMGLADKAREYRGKWGATQFPLHAAKLKAGDVTMMKRLLDWSIKEKIEFIPPCQELAQTIVEADPEYGPARLTLQHIKLSKGWMSMKEAIAGIDLQHAPDRLELHQALAAARPAKKSTDFPPDPTRDMEKMPDGYYRTATKNGSQPYFVATRNYDRSKPCALVIGLHGGGDGGLAESINSASTEAKVWARLANEGSWVVLCPTVRNHIANSWWDLENLESTFDAIEETVEQFNIDRKRIYVTGTSMGRRWAPMEPRCGFTCSPNWVPPTAREQARIGTKSPTFGTCSPNPSSSSTAKKTKATATSHEMSSSAKPRNWAGL